MIREDSIEIFEKSEFLVNSLSSNDDTNCNNDEYMKDLSQQKLDSFVKKHINEKQFFDIKDNTNIFEEITEFTYKDY